MVSAQGADPGEDQGEVDWRPPAGARSRMAAFAEAVSATTGRDLREYRALHAWSVTEPDAFWSALWEFAGLPDPGEGPALAEDAMPGARWFPDALVNYTEELLRDRDPDATAVVTITEADPAVEVTWRDLEDRVAGLAHHLRGLGIGRGDVVAGYLPNRIEAVVGLLATAAIGATWAVCGLDYSAEAALARLGQLRPAVLLTALRQRYGGRERDRRADVAELVAGLPSLREIVLGGADADLPGSPVPVLAWADATAYGGPLEVERVPVDHPLWVLFSSGTTGRPKGIVHGHGGVIVEYVKMSMLHWDLGPEDRLLWYTTPSWMMWNFLVSSLISGAAIVCYDGSPSHPAADGLWRVATEVGATVVGTSPAYLEACQKADVGGLARPGLRAVGVTGSTFAPETHRWLRSVLGPEPQIVSSSGGTDVVSAFAAGAPLLPVWVGELSAPCLGVDLAAYDPAGHAVVGEVGELVVRRPMPSMPIRFWADEDGSRYRAAYFADYPGVWRHGDWITLTERGSVVIHGRSDATLNRSGIRMGTADIYGPVESLPEVAEALVVGVERPDGSYWMPMFVVLAAGAELDDALRGRIVEAIRRRASPRHVPDQIVVAPGIPHTRTGKKLEVPVKRLLLGQPPAQVMDLAAVDDPALVEWYAGFAAGDAGPTLRHGAPESRGDLA